MRRTCSSRSLMERDRMLVYQWPAPTHAHLGTTAITSTSSSNSSSKVSEAGHGGADARAPRPESAAVTAVLQISHDGLGECVGKGGANWECNAGTTDRVWSMLWVSHRQIAWVTGPH
ncbi:hypothetical protein V8C35DRAFT_311120 [Trichoderma chlorosporum]